jgi:hypothetical protein
LQQRITTKTNAKGMARKKKKKKKKKKKNARALLTFCHDQWIFDALLNLLKANTQLLSQTRHFQCSFSTTQQLFFSPRSTAKRNPRTKTESL